MDIEICVEKIETATAADRLGANRIELCSALDLGGLTPSTGLIESCAEHCALDIFVMIRPRGGGFIYSSDELFIMEKDIINAKKAGANGVVFGCLTNDLNLNEYQNKKLLDCAKSLDLGVTFHRAFDFCSDSQKALFQLIDWGFDRLLTSGQKQTAILGINEIKQLTKTNSGKIEIMAGSGINPFNAKELMQTGVGALHFTAREKIPKNDSFNMGDEYVPDMEKMERIIGLCEGYKVDNF